MIDAHIHIVPPALPGVGSLSPVLRYPIDRVASIVREQMNSAGITHALCMGCFNITPDDPLGVAITLQIAQKCQGLFAIGIMDPTKDVEDHDHFRRVESAIQAGQVVALKAYLGYLHFAPCHPTYHRYYELAARYQVPVFFHCGDTYSPYAKLKYAHPLGVDEVAVDHPNTKFIIAHLGNPWMIDAAEVIYKNVNVWADLSGLLVGDETDLQDDESQATMADLAERMQKAIRYSERPNRFLFGTDWPLIPMRVYRDFIAGVVPTDLHEQLFEDNARLLFRLG